MEKNRTSPSSDLLEDIARFFNVSVNYLVTGKEYESNNKIIVGNENPHNIIVNGANLSEIDAEILKICANFSIREKNEVLSLIYEIERKKNEINNKP